MTSYDTTLGGGGEELPYHYLQWDRFSSSPLCLRCPPRVCSLLLYDDGRPWSLLGLHWHLGWDGVGVPPCCSPGGLHWQPGEWCPHYHPVEEDVLTCHQATSGPPQWGGCGVPHQCKFQVPHVVFTGTVGEGVLISTRWWKKSHCPTFSFLTHPSREAGVFLTV